MPAKARLNTSGPGRIRTTLEAGIRSCALRLGLFQCLEWQLGHRMKSDSLRELGASRSCEDCVDLEVFRTQL